MALHHFKRGKKNVSRYIREHFCSTSASVFTLQRRCGFGGRKGLRAAKRLRLMGIEPTPRGYTPIPFMFTDMTVRFGGYSK